MDIASALEHLWGLVEVMAKDVHYHGAIETLQDYVDDTQNKLADLQYDIDTLEQEARHQEKRIAALESRLYAVREALR